MLTFLLIFVLNEIQNEIYYKNLWTIPMKVNLKSDKNILIFKQRISIYRNNIISELLHKLWKQNSLSFYLIFIFLTQLSIFSIFTHFKKALEDIDTPPSVTSRGWPYGISKIILYFII